MNRSILLFAGAMLVSTSIAAETPKYPAAVFHNTIDYSAAGADEAISPDGKRVLVTSNATGVFNAYALDLKTGEQTALTDSTTNAVYAVSYFPDGERFLYTFDRGGDEINHLYVGGTGGEPVDITPGDKTKAAFVGWVDGGEAFIVQTNERDARYYDLYRYDADDYSRELVYQNDLALGGFAVSRDGAWAAGAKSEGSGDNDLYLIALEGDRTAKLITAHEGDVFHSAMSFTPENDALVYGSDVGGEFQEAWTHDLATGEKNKLLADAWDIWNVGFSPSGRYQVSTVNHDAAARVTILDRRTNKPVAMPDGLPRGDVQDVRFSPDEKTIALFIDADAYGANVYTAKLGDKKFRQLTTALPEGLPSDNVVVSEVVRYKSFDGLDIPGILYKPKDATAANPAPALVWVHGGPGGQSRTGYNPTIQHLVNHGYAVLAANNRGSSGYGKTFYHMDDQKHGEVDLQDIVFARTYLQGLDWIDDGKIGIIGGSYGGYMVMAALAFEPEVFDVGVNLFGVTNWVRTLESIPPWWAATNKSLFDELGDPKTDAERLRRISPLFHAQNVVRPLLVVQGARDPRVLQIESDEIVAAVKKNGVPVEYIVFPNEGHGFRSRANLITASEAYVEFLDAHLRTAGKGGKAAGQ